MHMVPAIRNILGGFLFSGDDVYKKVRVLSGGERTRLAVARMLLRPSNTLLLDEPTNHLDLDSKEVLLDALVDYGGTLIFVSHDRYFVERLATKIIEIGHGTRGRLSRAPTRSSSGTRSIRRGRRQDAGPAGRAGQARGDSEGRKADRSRRSTTAEPRQRRAAQAEARRARRRHSRLAKRRNAPTPRRASAQRAEQARQARIDVARSADRRDAKRRSARSSSTMAAPGFYDDRAAAQPVIDRHQALMWQVGDLMHQWEELQTPRRPRRLTT